jgi:type I restriction enzyme M protein
MERRLWRVLWFSGGEQSKIFDNAAFGYWKVTVERPLRIKGIDPERAYSPKGIKELRAKQGVDPDAPVIRKIHKSDAPDPLQGLFQATIKGRRCIIEYEPDSDLRDTEQVPLTEDGGMEAFIKREILPHAADAWIDQDATKIGYEISFNRYFYKPQRLRSLDEIENDIMLLEQETEGLLKEIIRVSL